MCAADPEGNDDRASGDSKPEDGIVILGTGTLLCILMGVLLGVCMRMLLKKLSYRPRPCAEPNERLRKLSGE